MAGGYYLARLAVAATAGAADDAWLAAKVATATFYAEQIMPQAAGHLGAVTAGAGTLFAIDDAHLGE